MEILEAKCLCGDSLYSVSLKLEYDDIEASIKLFYSDHFNFCFLGKGLNFFDALCDLRAKLEEKGYFLCINGSRIDFYPSNMTLQMSLGLVGYKIELGIQATEKLNTFDECLDLKKLVTVSEQKSFFSKWLKSL